MWLIVLGLALFFSSLNLFHVFYYATRIPTNAIFMGISHWYEDYFFYLSLLTQGQMGAFSLTNLYTTEPVPIGINWSINLALGILARITTLPVWLVYDGSIFLFSLVYIFLAYWILRRLFPTNALLRISALLIALTSSTTVSFFYSYTPALNRLGGIAHHVAQNIMSLLAVYVFANILDHARDHRVLPKRNLVLLTITLIALFATSSFYVAVDMAVFVVASCIVVVQTRSLRLAKLIVLIFVFLAMPLAILSRTQVELLRDPFWQFVRNWEANQPIIDFGTFFRSMGLLALLLPIGIGPFLKRGGTLRTIGAIYAFGQIALYFSPIPRWFGLPSFRILQPPAYVFFGAIAASGLSVIASIGKRKQKLLFGVFVTGFLLLQIPGLVSEVQARINSYYLNSNLNFVDRQTYEGLLYLKKLPRERTVLAFHTLETLVPAISGQRVYAGHGTLTIDYATKIGNVAAFYSLALKEGEARRFLTDNTIGYVLWQKDMGDAQALERHYGFLVREYENPSLTIFSVRNE